MALRQVVLSILSRQDMTGYDITRQFDDSLAFVWRATHQQVYRELALLHKDRCVTSRRVRQSDKPDRKVYSLTATGRRELKEWLVQPTAYDPPKVELLVKLLATNVVGAKAMREEITRQRGATRKVKEIFTDLDRRMRTEPQDPGCAPHELGLLALRRGELMLEAQNRWLAEVDDYLAAQKD